MTDKTFADLVAACGLTRPWLAENLGHSIHTIKAMILGARAAHDSDIKKLECLRAAQKDIFQKK